MNIFYMCVKTKQQKFVSFRTSNNKIHSVKMDIFEVIAFNIGLCSFSFFLYFL